MEVNIVSFATVEPAAWLAVIEKDERTWSIFPMSDDRIAGIHKSMLEDAIVVFATSEPALRGRLAAMVPEYREGTLRRVLPGSQ